MLRHLKIRSKLVAILLVPLVAIAVLGSLGVLPRLSQARDARQVAKFSRLAASISPLVHELQNERGLSALYLATHQDQSVLAPQHHKTDVALARFGKAFESIAIGPELGQALAIAQSDLAGVPDIRAAVLQRQRTVDEASAAYDDAITKLFGVLEVYSSESSFKSLELHRLASANFEITEVKENLAQTRSLVTAALLAGEVSPDAYGKLRSQHDLLQANLDQFLSDAQPIDRTRYSITQGGPDLAVAHAIEAKVLEVGQTGGTRVIGDALGYYKSAASATDNLVAVERSTNEALIAAAGDTADDAQRTLVLYGAGSLAALLVAVLLALVIGRSLVRPLRRLTEAAREVAEDRLPSMVDSIQHGAHVDTVLPRLDVRSRDEIGQLTEAFNSVQQVAMEVTTEQASLRKSIGDMFVNLGRRNQSLIDRQLELIDELEATERDPDSLQNLFALDHLVTRMRRNAENLLVLSGEEPPRKWGQALPLVDVIRAAVSEVQDYARVDVLAPDDLMIGGQVATDIAHLLAELVENATNFSPPTTRVRVRVERAENRTLVSVIDQGIGMTDADIEAANERLASPPATDLTLARCLGFYVIGRLARRTGVAVRLGRSSGGGVLAQLALGSDLVSLSGQPAPTRMSDVVENLTDSPSATKDRLLGALGAPPEERQSRAGRTPPSTNGNGDGSRNGNGSGVGSRNGSGATSDAAPPMAVPPVNGAPAGRSGGIYPLPVDGDGTLPARSGDGTRSGRTPTGPHSSGVADLDSTSGLPTRRPAPPEPAAAVIPVAPPVPTAPAAFTAPALVPPAVVPPAVVPPAVVPPAVVPPASAPMSRPGVPVSATPVAPAPQIPAPPAGSWPPPPKAPAADVAATPGVSSPGLPRREAIIAALEDRSSAASAPSAMAAAEPDRTAAGLPQRRAGASPRPGAQPPTTLLASTDAAAERSPEDVRAMLSRFRTGVERGRAVPVSSELAPDSQEDR